MQYMESEAVGGTLWINLVVFKPSNLQDGVWISWASVHWAV